MSVLRGLEAGHPGSGEIRLFRFLNSSVHRRPLLPTGVQVEGSVSSALGHGGHTSGGNGATGIAAIAGNTSAPHPSPTTRDSRNPDASPRLMAEHRLGSGGALARSLGGSMRGSAGRAAMGPRTAGSVETPQLAGAPRASPVSENVSAPLGGRQAIASRTTQYRTGHLPWL
jgi:hypothetical protein